MDILATLSILAGFVSMIVVTVWKVGGIQSDLKVLTAEVHNAKESLEKIANRLERVSDKQDLQQDAIVRLQSKINGGPNK